MSRAIVVAAGVTVLVLAFVSGAISYSHMLELARLHGEVGWRVHAFPVSVDGIEVVASLVLLAHRRSGTLAGWLPWAALAAGTAASLAANVAVGASDPVGRLVAGWPAVALLVAIKLMAGLLETAGPHGPGAGPGARVGDLGADTVAPGSGLRDPGLDGPQRTGPAIPPELTAAALAIRDQLVTTGTPVTRRSFAAGLRAAGHRVRNDRIGFLLASAMTEAGHRDG